MKEREAGIERLYPSLFGRMGTRFYYLRQLRAKIEFVTRTYISNKRILADYGCGNRPYSSIIAPFVDKYTGIDLPENPTADIHITPNGNIDLPDNYADIVLSTQVLEHVTDPKHYLKEANRILEKDGQLV